MAQNGTPLGSMVIQLGLDSTKMNDSLTKAQNQLRNFERQLKSQRGLSDFYKAGANAAKAYQSQKDLLNKSIQTQSQLLQKLKKEYDTEIQANGEMSKKAQRLAGQIEQGNAKLAQYAIQLREVTKQAYLASDGLNLAGDKLLAFSKRANNLAGGLDTVSQRTQALSLAIFGGMALSAKAAMDFESAFAGVKKTVDETANWSYEKLSSEIRKLAQELPASAVEISKVAEAAGQLGIKTEDIMSFTRVMIDLGESTNMTAEEASVALAKFKNITQMPAEDFKKLGNVIVQLGNNMATTEQDIVDMGLRLASSGKLAGLTEAQIMALAATLSSVGMEAEAGGSAMSRVMQKINTAVAEGAEGLEQYATVAGLSAEEFATKWKTEPQNAIVAFLRGLGRIKEEGGDVTQTLKDMEIANIRDIDSLQRLAGAGNLLADTLAMANEEWASGNALQIEAGKRYETTESKMKIARNRINDIAITLGGPLLDAFLDILDAADPLIDNIADMAKRFSELDEATQRNIINWALALGAISPVSKILSSTIGTVGDLAGGIGTLSKTLAGIGADKAANSAIEALGATSGIATNSVGGLTGAVGLLGNPMTWGVLLGGAALAGLSYLAIEATNAENRMQLWGAEVDKVQAGELSRLKEKVDETNRSMTLFADGAVEDIKEVEKSVKDLANSIIELTDKELAKDIKLAEKLGLDESVINALKNNAEDSKAYVQKLSDDILAIYSKHGNDHSKLNAEERSMVREHMNAMIQEQLEIQGYGKQEQIGIIKAMNGEISELNDTQIRNAATMTMKWMTEERSLYKQRKDDLLEIQNSIKGTDEESVRARQAITEQLTLLEGEYTAKMESYKDSYINLRRQTYEADKENAMKAGQTAAEYDALLAEQLKAFGITMEEFKAISTEATEAVGQNYKLLGKEVVGMSDEARQANQHWRELIWDEQVANLKTNASEEIQKALLAENGWENMQFILKHAEISTNAKAMIAEALVATGQWDALSPEDKALVVDNSMSIRSIFDSKTLLEQWNALSPAQKELLVQDLTAHPIKTAQEAIDSVKQTLPSDINATNKTGPEVAAAQAGIDAVIQRSPVQIFAQNQTAPQNSSAQSAIDSVLQKSPAKILAENQTANSVAAAQSAINSVRQHGPVAIQATDYASGVASSVTAAINSIPTYKLITLEAVRAGERGFYARGTDFHPGGLAVVNDQVGQTYKELVTLPSGESFIPQGRNVTLPLPRGSKVLTASRTENLMKRLGIPKYADGIGIPEDAKIFREISRANRSLQHSQVSVNVDNSQVVALLKEILKQLGQSTDQVIDLNVQLGSRTWIELVEDITRTQEKNERRRLRTSTL